MVIGEFGRVLEAEEAERRIRARYDAGLIPFAIFEPGQPWHGADVSYPVGGDWCMAFVRARRLFAAGMLARNAARLSGRQGARRCC